MDTRGIATATLLLALVAAALVYLQFIAGLGFPDGFVSARGAARRTLAWVFIAVSVVVAMGAGLIAARGTARAGALLLIAYLGTSVALVAVDVFVFAGLAGDAGG